MNAWWHKKKLHELNQEQWEQLCDGCGKCCLHKLQDDQDERVYYTDVACRYLDLQSIRCTDYPNRETNVPGCIELTLDRLRDIAWLPNSCAYKRRYHGKPLPAWHPLVAGNTAKMQKARIGVLGRVVSEVDVDQDRLEARVIRWV